MNINRENYEVYFLDYLEGNLSAEEVADLLVFVQENPDLKEEFDLLDDDLPTLDLSDENVFPDKDSLKRSAPAYDQDAVNFLFAKKLEGDLSKREEAELIQLMVQHKELQQQWNLFAKLKLTASEEEFLEKHSLKPIDLTSPQVMMAAALEGDLTSSEKEAFELLIQDENQKKSWQLMQQTRMSADKSVIYFGKDQLKKKAPMRFAAWRSVAAAAAVLLLLFTGWQFMGQDPVHVNSIAERNSGIENSRALIPVNDKSSEQESGSNNQTEIRDLFEESDSTPVWLAEEKGVEIPSNQEKSEQQRISVPEWMKVEKSVPQFASLETIGVLAKPEGEVQFADTQQEEAQEQNKVNPASDTEFVTLKTFVAQKARELSGINEDESMGEGLMAKALETLNDKTNGEVKVNLKDKEEDSSTQGWKVKIGKLELSHKKAG